MAKLDVTVNGIQFPNPFVIGSGPPSTNARVICRAFEAGWGGAVAKTVALTDTEVVNVTPRYGKLKSGDGGVYGFENIELISDRPLEVWLDEFREVKDRFPDHVLIGSIMEEAHKDRWQEVTERVQETGVDMLELNFSCPHGHPERKMGAAMGQVPEITCEVTEWVKEVATVPVWVKMTPNVTDVTLPAEAAQKGGADGVAAINTILSCIGVDPKTLRPQPTVEGHSTYGGYSAAAVKPIALRMVSEIARAMPGFPVSGIGGVMTAWDAIEHLLLGASTVQVCTGVMLRGHKMVQDLIEGLEAFMDERGIEDVASLVGLSLPYLTTHHDLVDRQGKTRAVTKAARRSRDNQWSAEIVKQTDALTATD